MPYTVAITADEAKLLTQANVSGVEGCIFTFEPRESMDILSLVANATNADAPGRIRLSDRLATLYGQHLTKTRKSASAQPLPLFDFDGPPNTAAPGTEVPVFGSEGAFVEAFDVDPTNETPVELPEPEPVAPPKRKRGR